MKVIFTLVISLLLISCGTVAPRDPIDANQWVQHDHKTDYFVRDTSDNAAYLTVKYASHTFFDKSTEMVPVAKSVFNSIADQLSKKRQRNVVIDASKFYESVAYNGVTGVSTALVSNDIRFILTPESVSGNSSPDSKNVVIRLDQLEKAFKAGLITKHEYEEKRQVIMNQF